MKEPLRGPDALQKEGHMIEELKRMLYELDEEDLYLLYVTALEMLRHKQGRE